LSNFFKFIRATACEAAREVDTSMMRDTDEKFESIKDSFSRLNEEPSVVRVALRGNFMDFQG